MIDGIIGKKIGMTQLFQDDGKAIAVTVIQAGPSIVTQVKSQAKDGYNAIQMGFVSNEAKQSHLSCPKKGHLKGIDNIRHLYEFRTNDIESIKRGDHVDIGFLKSGDFVKVRSFSKGKGFAGVVKRYHFAGGPKTHGQTDRHRAPGSIGATTSPGRVFKGKHMAGHMGNERITIDNLKVMQTDLDRNLLLLKGSVPGAKGGLLIIERVR